MQTAQPKICLRGRTRVYVCSKRRRISNLNQVRISKLTFASTTFKSISCIRLRESSSFVSSSILRSFSVNIYDINTTWAFEM